MKVNPQDLMDHTVKRLIVMQQAEIMEYLDLNDMKNAELILLSTWGLDGSSGHSQYHQRFPSCSQRQEDEDLLATATTPIRLSLSNDLNKIFWFNQMPQSVRFCRPIILEFIKETKEIVLKTKEEVELEFSNLKPVQVELSEEKSVSVSFDFVMSMIDGKILTFITGTSSMQCCPICGASPNKMNDKKELEKGFPSRLETLQYGISPLHAWMRFLECLLHISYRIQFKQWRVTKEFRDVYQTRKQEVMKKLYESFGVRVDEPRAGGSGNSTTGNVCRRLFSDPELLSNVLEIDRELVVRFKNILITINCQQPVNPQKVDVYARETYRYYLSCYAWYKIPASVHKVLAHCGEIIIHSPAPVGMIGEEASECRNKYYRRDREIHARKTTREDNLYDVFIRAMNSSDPLISSISIGINKANSILKT